MDDVKAPSKPREKGKISVCDVMKEDTSRVIQKLESQIPLNLQQYSDLYSAYLHTLEDVFGTCYISEKEFFDKLNIDQGILAAYQNYSNTLTDTFLDQIELLSKIKEQSIQAQKSNLQIFDKFMHSMMDSYAKSLLQYNKVASSWFSPKNFKISNQFSKIS
ncbi:MAG: hypothetical protein PVG23_01980 [Nitrosopumilaceae archaeon]|jgi:hypothetical protein